MFLPGIDSEKKISKIQEFRQGKAGGGTATGFPVLVQGHVHLGFITAHKKFTGNDLQGHFGSLGQSDQFTRP